MRVAQYVLLSYISRWSVEVKSAATYFDTTHNSKVRRREGINSVVREAGEEEISIIDLVIDSGIVSVGILCLVWTDGEVVTEHRRTRVRRSWE